MCVQDSDHPADQDLLKSSNLYHTQPPINNNSNNNNDNSNQHNGISNEGPPDFQSQIDFLNAQMQNTSSPNSNSLPLESISEDTAVASDEERNASPDFLPILRSGEWADIGGRDYMEDTHVCIVDLAKKFGCSIVGDEAVSFYGVFDGHGGKAAAQFVCDHLPRVIVEDADFPLNLEKAVARSFIKTDDAFAESCSRGASHSSGTTALTAMIFGRWATIVLA